jgi:maltose alpha-D-glucosyltransferase/alpha-amylase
MKSRLGLDHDPFWYKNGVIYEVHVRAFYDSNADGTGDFRGLTQKLDYMKDLGVTAIWLLPFYPSPLKDDGYDIADYCAVHPSYGTLADFKTFLREAHRRGLRVIIELVLNHTSDQHPWFQRARRAEPGSRWRDFYVWSDTAKEYHDARVIFKDVEQSNWTWDHVAKAYFWHRFFSHQPDLNYESSAVHAAMFKVVDFWLDLGVDGLRLDAVPYLYEREGTSCENLPETHAFLKKLRQHVDENYGDRMLLGEANQWPEDAVSYFGEGRGDECHMAYHFPLMPRLFMSVRMEDRQPIVDILEQTPLIPETSQWALFLRNHDELTLEMVTDEERDYMYRMYAHVDQARLNLGIRRRLAPLMNNDRKSIELLNALLFSLPGTPVLYYGDEIGLGENIFLGDRNGVRTPMQWSSDKNAGFSRANPQSLYLPIILDPGYHYEANNVEVQLGNPHSLLWWMRRLLAMRKRWRALGEGKCEFLQTENRKILSYILRFEKENLLVVANLSRFPQPVELDLSAFQHTVPTELFGRTEFPAISDKSYFPSLGPHSFYWFSLEPKSARVAAQLSSIGHVSLPCLSLSEDWRELLTVKNRFDLREILPDYLRTQPWFKGKRKTTKLFTLKESIPIKLSGAEAMLTFLQVDYVDGDSETYSLPLAFASGAEAETLRHNSPERIIAEIKLAIPSNNGVLYDAFGSQEFCGALLDLIWRVRSVKGIHGQIDGLRLPELRKLMNESSPPKPTAARQEQNNSSVIFEDKLILKLFRRLEPGLNPELEMGHFLSAHSFANCQTVAGGLEYLGPTDSSATLAVVHAFIPSATTAWDFTLDALGRYFDRVITWVAQGQSPMVTPPEPLQLLQPDFKPEVAETIGTFLESVRLLGVRTGELHRVLASDFASTDFTPEISTPHRRRAVFQSMRNLALQNLRLLRIQIQSSAIPPQTQPLARRVAELEPAIVQHYRALCDLQVSALLIRLHGDFRLSQILWTGKDFVFIDFEGESSIPISERRLKHSPLRDVAMMLRSFHYAAAKGLEQHVQRGSIPPENMLRFQSWLRYWNLWVGVAYLKAYFQTISSANILPQNEDSMRIMLRAYLLDRAMNELGRQLKEDGAHLEIPLTGILVFLRENVPPAPVNQPTASGSSQEQSDCFTPAIPGHRRKRR